MYKGVQIDSDFNIDERLTVSGGTTATHRINGVTLEKPVTIATGGWHVPDSSQLNILLRNKRSRHEFNQINLLKLDARTRASLKELHLERCRNPEDFLAVFNSRTWENAKQQMRNFAGKFDKADSGAIEIGPTFKSGGLQGTTVNENTGKFTGLHIDSWEMYNCLHDRKMARNRICFNIGIYPRYFCFLNIDVQQIYQLMTANEPESFHGLCGNYIPFVWKFFEENRNYPVTRIRVDPFEAYIAPTENILHDGSTEDNPFVDIFYTLRSYYKRSSKKRGIK